MMGSGYMWNGGAGGFPMSIMPIMMIIVALVVTAGKSLDSDTIF